MAEGLVGLETSSNLKHLFKPPGGCRPPDPPRNVLTRCACEKGQHTTVPWPEPKPDQRRSPPEPMPEPAPMSTVPWPEPMPESTQPLPTPAHQFEAIGNTKTHGLLSSPRPSRNLARCNRNCKVITSSRPSRNGAQSDARTSRWIVFPRSCHDASEALATPGARIKRSWR